MFHPICFGDKFFLQQDKARKKKIDNSFIRKSFNRVRLVCYEQVDFGMMGLRCQRSLWTFTVYIKIIIPSRRTSPQKGWSGGFRFRLRSSGDRSTNVDSRSLPSVTESRGPRYGNIWSLSSRHGCLTTFRHLIFLRL